MPTITVQTTISYKRGHGYDERDICLALTKMLMRELEDSSAPLEIAAIEGVSEFTVAIPADVDENEEYEYLRRHDDSGAEDE